MTKTSFDLFQLPSGSIVRVEEVAAIVVDEDGENGYSVNVVLRGGASVMAVTGGGLHDAETYAAKLGGQFVEAW